MYLSTSNPGHTLTAAYGCGKQSPGLETMNNPKSDPPPQTRRVIYDAARKIDRYSILSTPLEPMEAKNSRRGRRDFNGQLVDRMQAAEIIHSAECLGVGFAHWARFAYDPDHRRGWLASANWLIDQTLTSWRLYYPSRHNMDPKKAEDLAMLCVQDAGNRAANGQPFYTNDQICQMLGYKNANTANWHRTLKPHYDYMAKGLDYLNSAVMAAVYRKTRELLEI